MRIRSCDQLFSGASSHPAHDCWLVKRDTTHLADGAGGGGTAAGMSSAAGVARGGALTLALLPKENLAFGLFLLFRVLSWLCSPSSVACACLLS